MPTRWIFVLLLWCQVLSSTGQTYAPASFHEVPPPTVRSAAWSKLNYAPGYAVKNVDGKLVVGKSTEQPSTQLQTADGTFLGRGHGEWGGQLLFQSKAKRSKPIAVKEGNIRLIFQANGHVFFIEGDERHTQVVTLSEGPGPQRWFSNWSMAFGRVDTSELEQVYRAVETHQLPLVVIDDPHLQTLLHAFGLPAPDLG